MDKKARQFPDAAQNLFTFDISDYALPLKGILFEKTCCDRVLLVSKGSSIMETCRQTRKLGVQRIFWMASRNTSRQATTLQCDLDQDISLSWAVPCFENPYAPPKSCSPSLWPHIPISEASCLLTSPHEVPSPRIACTWPSFSSAFEDFQLF